MKTMRYTIGRGMILALGIAIACASGAEAGGRIQKDDIREIMRKTKALYGSTATAEVQFEQSSGEGKAFGLLVFAGNDKFRLELPKQTIVNNGQKVWTYTPEKRQVVVSNASRSAGRLTPGEILTAFPGDYATALAGDATVNGRPVWVVRCTPGSGQKIGDVTMATLYIDKATYRFQQVEIESPSIGSVKLRITEARYGIKLSDGRFAFTPPEGVRVVDLSR